MWTMPLIQNAQFKISLRKRVRGSIGGYECPAGGSRGLSIALTQLKEHQSRAIFKLQGKPVPADLILIQDAGAEFMVFPGEPADWILRAIHLQGSLRMQARLAVIVGCVCGGFPFPAVAVLPMQNDSHFIGKREVQGDLSLGGLQPIQAGSALRDAPILDPDVIRFSLCTRQSRSRTSIALKGIKLVACDVTDRKMRKVNAAIVPLGIGRNLDRGRL